MAGKNRNDNTKGRIRKPLTLYFDPELYDYLDNQAKKNGRSLSSQITFMLEEVFAAKKYSMVAEEESQYRNDKGGGGTAVI